MDKLKCNCGWEGEKRELIRSTEPNEPIWLCPACAEGEFKYFRDGVLLKKDCVTCGREFYPECPSIENWCPDCLEEPMISAVVSDIEDQADRAVHQEIWQGCSMDNQAEMDRSEARYNERAVAIW